MADGSMAFRRLMEYLDENRDVFENEIGDDKRPLYSRDIAVILANADGTGEVTVQYRLEQDW